jgi:pimeloyl-ACP methyl ester carboxylesterase
MAAIERITVEANAMVFTCLRCGAGDRLALCLHGFPDDAGSMTGIITCLAGAGFTAVAPYTRGYAPTSAAPDGCYDLGALAGDAIALVDALGFSSAVLVGHDWGAATAYVAANLDRDRFPTVVTIAVPPLGCFSRGLGSAAQLRRSWYMGRFQLPGAASHLRANDFALIDRLWRDWSPGWSPPSQHLAAVKQTFAHAQTVPAAIGYYRALIPKPSPRGLRRYRDILRVALSPPGVPTLMIAGQRDGCIGPELYENACRGATAPCRVERIADAGHFAHLERPESVEALIRDHLLSE